MQYRRDSQASAPPRRESYISTSRDSRGLAVLSSHTTPYPGYWKPGIPYASWAARLVAYIIDSAIILAPSLIFDIVFSNATCQFNAYNCTPPKLPAIGVSFAFVYVMIFGLAFIAGIVVLVTWPISWARSGQTIGARIMRIRVIRQDGQKLGYQQAALRLLALCFLDEIVFGLPLGQLWHFVDSKRRTWHDLEAVMNFRAGGSSGATSDR